MFDGKELQESFEEVFGFSITNLNVRQLWWLVRFAKFIRYRARNNSAFNNYMNRNFSHATFRQIQKERNGERFEGLQITIKDSGEVLEQENKED